MKPSSVAKPALGRFGILTVLTGVVYPLLINGLAQAIFLEQANGSLIEPDGGIGSRLIGQPFSHASYF